MEPQQAEQSSGRGKRKIEKSGSSSTTRPAPSALTMETVAKIQKRPRRYLHPKTRCTLHDNTSIGYGWLLPGWVAEEHHVESGRVYRYYYDPAGNHYKTQQDVILAYEKSGLVVIDT